MPRHRPTSPHTADHLHHQMSQMSNLLQIASRVEAAVGAYNSVQGIVDKQEWKAEFSRELVSVHDDLRSV